jgi:glucarate dehydratase
MRSASTPDQRLPGTASTIASIEAIPANLPLTAPYRWVAGLNYGFTKVVVRLLTGDGFIGLGEASSWRHARIIEEEIAPRLLGLPVSDLRRCWRAAVPPVQTLYNIESLDVVRAYGAVEMALWDVLGKIAERPLYELWGGRVRTRVAFTEYFASRERAGKEGGEETPEQIAAYCARMGEEHGSRIFEGKVGYSDIETDVSICHAVREAIGPAASMRLDANMGWTLPSAREVLARTADCRISNIEDPVGGLEAMAQLRRNTAIAFSTHDTNLRAAARLGVPDSFVLNATALGGLDPTRHFITACELMGIGFSFFSGETGIGVAAYLQIAANNPYLTIPSQSLLRWYKTDVIVGGPFSPEEDHLDVPKGAGLGVEIDTDRLREAHRCFLENGPLEEAAKDPRFGVYRQPPLY